MKGQTLIEVLVALGIITIVVTALAAIVISSQGSAKFSKDKNLASQFAQEGIEIVRHIRDSNYLTFKNFEGDYCLPKGAFSLASNCNSTNIDNHFLRKITITQSKCAPDIAHVKASVSWQDSKCTSANIFCHESILETCLNATNPNLQF